MFLPSCAVVFLLVSPAHGPTVIKPKSMPVDDKKLKDKEKTDKTEKWEKWENKSSSGHWEWQWWDDDWQDEAEYCEWWEDSCEFDPWWTDDDISQWWLSGWDDKWENRPAPPPPPGQSTEKEIEKEKGAAKAAEGDDDEANAPPEMDMVANEYSESRRGIIRKKKKVDDSADGGDTMIEVDVEQ